MQARQVGLGGNTNLVLLELLPPGRSAADVGGALCKHAKGGFATNPMMRLGYGDAAPGGGARRAFIHVCPLCP